MNNSTQICHEILNLLPSEPVNHTPRNAPTTTNDQFVQCDIYNEPTRCGDTCDQHTKPTERQMRVEEHKDGLDKTDLIKLLTSIPSLTAFVQHQSGQNQDDRCGTSVDSQNTTRNQNPAESKSLECAVVDQREKYLNDSKFKRNKNLEDTLNNRSNKILNHINPEKLYKPDENRDGADTDYRNTFILKSIKNLTSYDLCKSNITPAKNNDTQVSTPCKAPSCVVQTSQGTEQNFAADEILDFVDIYGDLELLNPNDDLDKLSESLVTGTLEFDDVKENIIVRTDLSL